MAEPDINCKRLNGYMTVQRITKKKQHESGTSETENKHQVTSG
jgi:hypothetical protein